MSLPHTVEKKQEQTMYLLFLRLNRRRSQSTSDFVRIIEGNSLRKINKEMKIVTLKMNELEQNELISRLII